MSAAVAYLERDFRVAWSYRLGFFSQFVLAPFALVTVWFLSKLVGPQEALAPYGGDYFAFALLGAELQMLTYPLLTVFRGAVREAQVTGTLEAIFTTRANPAGSVLASGLYQSLRAAVHPLVLLPLVAVALGAPLAWASSPAALGVLGLSALGFAGVGLCSAAFTIAFRQTEPFTVGVFTATSMLSGVMFPIALLPEPIRFASYALPLTHAVEALRGVFIVGAEVSALGWHLAALVGFALLFPAGLLAVSRAVEAARRRGTLGQY